MSHVMKIKVYTEECQASKSWAVRFQKFQCYWNAEVIEYKDESEIPFSNYRATPILTINDIPVLFGMNAVLNFILHMKVSNHCL